MKKLLYFLSLLLAITVIFAGCKKDEKDDPATDGDQPTTVTKYTVKWVDENGNTLTEAQVEEGKTPSYSYSVTDTAEWDYTFMGWSASQDGEVLAAISPATANATYYAKVTKVKQQYTVTFNTLGGSEVASQTVEYGAKATMPDAPTYDGYRFVGWSASETEVVAVDFEKAITGNTEYFAVWNEVIDIKGMLRALLNGYELNPFAYIPESMRADFSENVVDADDIVTDYSSFVNVSDVHYGFGEQWHMILDNLEQSKVFFNVLSVVETLSATSITAFNNYIDANPSDTAHHEFASGIYNITVRFDGRLLYYVLDYTADIPVFGNQTVQIALTMDAETGEKSVRVQVGDANALTYTILENSYEFAIKYLGVRRAMFSIKRDDDGNAYGHIYEYLTVADAEMASAADFYITEDHVSVVGNKADGMLGFTGYINELYDAASGQLLGYEVQETLSSIVYNTLWFNLSDMDGISSLKYKVVDDKITVYVNGSSDKWQSKNVGTVGAKYFSRRYDIEMRTQYVYSYDEAEGKYVEHKIQVPMIFVQEENFDTFVSDVYEKNKINVALNVAEDNLAKILEDYDTLIPIFIENKNIVTPEVIIAYIGEKITF